jgi:outer membrane protein TolC
MTNAITGSVGITWPTAPWVRKKFDAQRLEAEARRQLADATARAMENQVGQMVQETLVRAQSAEQRATLIKNGLLPQAEHGLELARLAYQTDRGSFLDVIDTARAIVELRRDLVRAETDRQNAVIALERAVGSDLLTAGAPPQGDLR